MHYYKFNIAGWTLSTSHLSLAEEAIYFRLINHYYDTEKPIPEETHSVFRRLRLGNDSDIANTILNEFFTLTDKGWVQSRCEENLKEYRKTSKKNKLNGSKGGRPSKNAASSVTQKKPTGLDSVSQNNPNYELLTTNHKLETRNYLKAMFDVFWKGYPKTQGKAQALKTWTKLNPNQHLFDLIISSVVKFKASNEWTKDGGQFIPNASTWLNGERWEDELTYGAIPNGQDRPKQHIKETSLERMEREQAAMDLRREAPKNHGTVFSEDGAVVSTQVHISGRGAY
jgi:uncharacterized protein YdaU (DUF1376 family)